MPPDTPTTIPEALLAVQQELPIALERNAEGSTGGRAYRYTTLDVLLELVRPVLNSHGLVLTQEPTLAGVETILYLASDPEQTFGFTTPTLHAGTMQSYGAAVTYARRYALTALLGLASEDDTDAPSHGTAGAAAGPAGANGYEAATEPQKRRIKTDCLRHGYAEPDYDDLTKAQASQIIEDIATGTYDAAGLIRTVSGCRPVDSLDCEA